jgi:protein-tyrosine phosphatase
VDVPNSGDVLNHDPNVQSGALFDLRAPETSTEVHPRLWLGEWPGYERRHDGWVAMTDARGVWFQCAQELRREECKRRGRSHMRVDIPMYDHEAGFTCAQSLSEADFASRKVAEALTDGQTVLVTCQAGINRSALVAALALVRLGHSPQDAVAAVRKRNDICLCNKRFLAYVYEFAQRLAAKAQEVSG